MDVRKGANKSIMNRRSVLKGLGLSSIALLSSPKIFASTEKRPITLAHITDVHLLPTHRAEKGFARTLRAIQNDKVDFIINGGDSIMDALSRPEEKVKKQWKAWNEVLKDECSLQVYHALGNHDTFGSGGFSNYEDAKNIAKENLNLKKSYYHFKKQNWNVIVLDSINAQGGRSYEGRIGEEQFEWLGRILNDIPESEFVLITTHIPILSIAASFHPSVKHVPGMPNPRMHLDSARLLDLFAKYPQVKVCLSGHLHMQDHVSYQNIDFYCNGSVCGNYWFGDFKGNPAGYATIELFEDGTAVRKFKAVRKEGIFS
jgi:3',5'-cyclic-AMP phosphodiesterase